MVVLVATGDAQAHTLTWCTSDRHFSHFTVKARDDSNGPRLLLTLLPGRWAAPGPEVGLLLYITNSPNCNHEEQQKQHLL